MAKWFAASFAARRSHWQDAEPPRLLDVYLPKMLSALAKAAEVVASGKLRLPITAAYKPSKITEAIEHYERGGKVLLDFN